MECVKGWIRFIWSCSKVKGKYRAKSGGRYFTKYLEMWWRWDSECNEEIKKKNKKKTKRDDLEEERNKSGSRPIRHCETSLRFPWHIGDRCHSVSNWLNVSMIDRKPVVQGQNMNSSSLALLAFLGDIHFMQGSGMAYLSVHPSRYQGLCKNTWAKGPEPERLS